MFCKKCGSILNDDLLCSFCGFQNVLVENVDEAENTSHKQNESTSVPIVKEDNISNEGNVASKNRIWAVLSSVMFIISFIPLYKGYDKMHNYYSSETFYSLNRNAYVGGDAYNYIINAGYSTAYYVLAIGFAILGVVFLIVYYLSDRKVH